MKNSFKISFIIFALFVSSLQIFAQDTYNLNYKLEKGKTYFYRTTLNMDMTINAMGQEMNTKNESKTKMRLEVADIVAGDFEIISSFDSLYSKQGNPMGEDIINNGENVIGKKTKIVYNPSGKKIKTVEIDKIESASGMSGSGNSSILMQLAEKPVKIGDVWNMSTKDTNKVGEEGSMINTSETEYKIEGKETVGGVECLKITFKANLKIEGSLVQQGMDIAVEGTGKSTGTILFDLAKGLLYSVDNDLDISSTMVLAAQNMTMPMTQKMKTTIQYLEN